MANELNTTWTTGATIYAVITNASNQYWNTSGSPAFESYNAAHWTNYAVGMTENGASGRFVGTFPTGINTAGIFNIEFRVRATGTALTSDSVAASGPIVWSGSAEVLQSGDSFSRIGAVGAGLSALAPASTALSNAVWTNAKAAFVDVAISSRSTFSGSIPTTAQIATSIFTDLMAGADFNTTGSFGKLIKNNIDQSIGSIVTTLGTPNNNTIAGDIADLAAATGRAVTIENNDIEILNA